MSLVLTGCTSGPATDAVSVTAPSTSTSSASAQADDPPTTQTAPAPAPDAAPAVLTVTDGDTPVTLVSDSFTGSLSGYRVIDGTDSLDSPAALAVTADDRELYVVTGQGPDSRLIRLREGMDSWDLLGAGAGVPLDQPVDVAVGPGRLVAVLNAATGRLVVSRDDAATWTELAPATEGRTPSAVAITPDGALAVVDADADTASISADGGTTWTVTDRATGSFASPVDIAAAPDGALLVLNSGDGSLSVLRAGAATWENIPAAAAGWTSPTAVAAGPGGEVLVADPGSGALFRSADGGRTWTGSDGFGDISGLTVGADGTVAVTDGVNTLLTLQPTAAAVRNLVVTPTGPGTVEVSWDPARTTDGPPVTYRIEVTRAPTEAAWADLHASLGGSDPDAPETGAGPAFEVTTPSATIPDLPAGTDVTVSVVAVDGAGVGAPASTTVHMP
nr:fibronectin type III domain-containing protein [Nakamurella flavida]